MANPYPIEIAQGGVVTQAGALTFTDAANQPGSGTVSGPVDIVGPASGVALTVEGEDAGNDALVVKDVADNNVLLAGDDVGGVFIGSVTGSNSVTVTSAGTAIAGRSGFNGTAPIAKPAVTGALSTVADAPAKAVLTSIIAALTNYGLVTNSTT